jgi:hypothetical protein
MGAAGSRLEKALGEQFPEGERYFGLENFGNTCYCNSVLQVRRGRRPESLSLSARCDASCYPRQRRGGFVGSLPCGGGVERCLFREIVSRCLRPCGARAEDQR